MTNNKELVKTMENLMASVRSIQDEITMLKCEAIQISTRVLERTCIRTTQQNRSLDTGLNYFPLKDYYRGIMWRIRRGSR